MFIEWIEKEWNQGMETDELNINQMMRNDNTCNEWTRRKRWQDMGDATIPPLCQQSWEIENIMWMELFNKISVSVHLQEEERKNYQINKMKMKKKNQGDERKIIKKC